MNQSLVQVSKFLSLILRHKPETIGLRLDDQGWVEIDRLLHAATQHGTPLTRDLLNQVVTENDKQRFAISDDGSRIRANQGHSVQIDLALVPIKPPALLYHGTVRRFVESIMQHGLKAGSRQHVHLSPDVATATIVGKRRGSPVIFVVRTGQMHLDGYMFYCSANGVWLTDHVPVTYLQELADS